MKIEKAIKLINHLFVRRPQLIDPDYDAAIKLGLEALKRILREREIENDPGWGHLPGETDK